MSVMTSVKQFKREIIEPLNTTVYAATAIACGRDGIEAIVLGPTPEAAYGHACEYFGDHMRMDLAHDVIVMTPEAYRMLLAKAGYASVPMVRAESEPKPGLRPVKHVGRRRKRIFAEADGKCHYCGVALVLDGDWHVEHKMPRALGGGDEPTNLVASCIPCNKEKLDTTDIEFKAKLAKKAEMGNALAALKTGALA